MSEMDQQQVDMTYRKLREYFRTAERQGQHLTGYIVFSPASFEQPYPLESRTYAVSSDNKAFQPNMGGYSIYASSLDGSDPLVRLEQYMAAEYGGKDGWQVERCYMMTDEVERANELLKNERKKRRSRTIMPCSYRRRRGGRHCLNKQRICPYRFRLTGVATPL